MSSPDIGPKPNRVNDTILPPDVDPMEDIGYKAADPETTARIRQILDGNIANTGESAVIASTPSTTESISEDIDESLLKNRHGTVIGKKFTRADGETEIVLKTEERYGARQMEAKGRLSSRPPRPSTNR